MSAELSKLSIADLEMLLDIQREKAARQAEEKRKEEEAAREAERAAAAKAAKKAQQEAKAEKAKAKKAAGVVKKRKSAEVVESGSEAEPEPSRKKAKGKARAVSVESAEESGEACLRCRNNKIACVPGSGRGKACAACVKAKQRCEGVLVEVGRSRSGSAGMGDVVGVLRDIVEELRGIRSGIEALEYAIDPSWSDEEESDGSEEGGSDGSEVMGELVGLGADYAEYRAFWMREHGTEYRETGVWMKENEGLLMAAEAGKGKGKRKEDEGRDEMEVDGEVAGPSGSAA